MHAHIHTKNYSPETECRLIRSLTETGGESGGDLRRTPQQNLLKNRTEKKRKEKKKLSKGKYSSATEREPAKHTETTEERQKKPKRVRIRSERQKRYTNGSRTIQTK
jgi:hypothetical protein